VDPDEERRNVIRGINKDIDALYQIPQIIRQAMLVYESLPPKSKARQKIVKLVRKLRKELINLDVVCQDIEWSISQRNLKQQTDFFEAFNNANTNPDTT
tara:strand:+ start:272 stop:568 length:297 start_codon:yes stop_codon:yes gene_type:complete